MPITALIPVYNEEKRIEQCIQSFLWCDEILVIDKNSNDNTREILKKYRVKIINHHNSDYFETSEVDIFLANCTTDWVIAVTASDIIHPQLVEEIQKLIKDNDFQYDAINIPYRRYVLGLNDKRSPWYSGYHTSVFKKSILRINHSSVHESVSLKGDKIYNLRMSDDSAMYHLTHETVDQMMDRHLRYWRGEARVFPIDRSMFKAFKPIMRSTFDLVFLRKTWRMGWDGIALMMAFMSYLFLRFVYIWERRSSNAPKEYLRIRDSISKAWDETKGEVIVNK